MSMNEFWAQDRLLLTLELFAIVVVVLLAFMVARSFNRQGGLAVRLKSLLASRQSIALFKAVRFAMIALGAVTLWTTFLPGLTPFGDRVDANLGLGGMVLFFLWPLVITQIALNAIPFEKKIPNEPVLIWLAMAVAVYFWIAIDKTVIGLVFN